MKSNALLPLIALIAVSAASPLFARGKLSAQTVQAPRFQVDPFWPKPLPTHTILGSVTGLAIDAQDHVWVVNLTNSFVTRTESGADQDPPIGECCFPSSPVLEFDASGKLVGHWGGPGSGYTWPMANHGIAIDDKGNVWISGNGPRDTQILQFTRDGKFIKSFGVAATAANAAPSATAPDTAYAGVSGAQRGGAGAAGAGGGRGGRGGRGAAIPPLPANSNSADAFGGATEVSFDFKANEAYVADGSRNHRIAVIDLNTGAIKRSWGAYGKPATDNAATPYQPTNPQFGNPVRCAELSRDGLVYVCDQQNNRIQVFDKTGKFVKEKSVAPATKGAGSVWDIAFSRDNAQRYLYVADGQNMKVRILDRNTLDEISTLGDGGRYPGQFFAVHSIATDSKGNVFTAETLEGKRIQKFEFLGVKSGPKNQGVVPQKKGGSK
jgi:DNA-binding beta-propeller fold protein YncE